METKLNTFHINLPVVIAWALCVIALFFIYQRSFVSQDFPIFYTEEEIGVAEEALYHSISIPAYDDE